MNRGWFFLKCALFGLVAVLLIGYVTMLLWNWLVPLLFNGPVVTYWQALGLLLLSKILFWGFGGKRCGNHTAHSPAPYWKHRFYEKFSNMSPEDREVFKKKMKEKWCNWEEKCSGERSGASKVD